jgi:8-oxo-dGTP pyrophosphatase MutT (NUDIX family)
MFSEFIFHLKTKLEFPLPGEAAQFELAHVQREHIITNSEEAKLYRPSAVLICIYPNAQNEPTILLIERPTYDGHHSGQIGFPGGKTEPTDFNLEATALREFTEETGCLEIPHFIGSLTPVYIPISKFMVQPYLAYLDKKPIFHPDEREVFQLIELSVTDLVNPDLIKETIVTPTPTLKFKTPYFAVNDSIVWGATAMILNELKVMIMR